MLLRAAALEAGGAVTLEYPNYFGDERTRIAIIGVTVDHWGSKWPKACLHEVQGWMVFILSTVVLVIESVALARIGADRRPWQEVLRHGDAKALRRINGAAVAQVLSAVLRISRRARVFSGAVMALPSTTDELPTRESFVTFPLQFGNWSGRREVMQADYLDALKLDDYLLADYVRAIARRSIYTLPVQTRSAPARPPILQRPACPGRLADPEPGTDQRRCVEVGGQPLRVNRALIQNDEQRQLVYYWFLQRGGGNQ